MRSDSITLFGVSGDLARKMTFASLYKLASRGRLDMPIVGVAFDRWSDQTLRDNARRDIAAAGIEVDDGVWEEMAPRMRFVQGDFSQPDTYQHLARALDGSERPLFYLEVPPALFETVVKGIHHAGLVRYARVVIEKPFGSDLDSAVALNAALCAILDEEQIFRIDHYLGKNAVEDIMVWRFANRAIEPTWNRENIESIQITMAESFDVADRGSFYDGVGALKDVVQNHMMQVTGLLAMEPPIRNTPSAIHAEQIKVFNAMRPVDPERYVRGQYNGYQDVTGVAKDSTTETYCALRISIDSWRWAGVPFFIRTGKSLGMTATEAVIRYRRPPLTLFEEKGVTKPEPNLLRIQLGPTDGVQLQLQAKDPSGGMRSKPVSLSVDFGKVLGEEPLPYELLLDNALDGDSTLFATEEMIEGTWRALAPILDRPGPVYCYERGTMGPAEANRLVEEHGGWVDPIGEVSARPA